MFVRAVGWIATLALPGAAILWLAPRLPHLPTPARFVALFLLPLTAGYLGVVVREPVLAAGWWVRDALLAVVMALLAWAFARFLVQAGGGRVDPALVAALGAYVLVLWPAVKT